MLKFKENPENELKPVYAAGSIEWGAWPDAYTQRNKYWLGKTLRKYEMHFIIMFSFHYLVLTLKSYYLL